MEVLIPAIISFFDEDKKVIITAVGNSMRPLIRHKKDGIILEKYTGQSLCIGDMIFYRRKCGRYVLHRIMDIDSNNNFTMLGDNQIITETGINRDQIVAIPIAIIRGKKTISVSSKFYKLYTRIYVKSAFLRILHIKLFAYKNKLYRAIKKIFNK